MSNISNVNRTEYLICAKLVRHAIANGYMVSVYDGEEWTVKKSRKHSQIIDAMFSTDMDQLKFRNKETGESIGNVILIYGNGPDVISDWHDTEAMNKLLEPFTA